MQKHELNAIHGAYFDTINIIQADCAQDVLERAMQLCGWYHRLLNRFEEGGDLYAINHAGGQAVSVHPRTAELLTAGLEICRASGGAFNMCIGPLTRLWNFKSPSPVLPDATALEEMKAFCDWKKVEIDGTRVRIPQGFEIDVGGIAKGYITDRVAEFLSENGARHAVLNFGGNIVTIGKRPDGKPWTIGLQTPGGEIGKDFWAAVSMENESIVTSATYARGFTLDGRRYHHILDPRTGYPVDHGLNIVTVRGRQSLYADGISTACFVLGPDEGAQLAARYGLEAAFRLDDGRVLCTPGMQLRVKHL